MGGVFPRNVFTMCRSDLLRQVVYALQRLLHTTDPELSKSYALHATSMVNLKICDNMCICENNQNTSFYATSILTKLKVALC